MAGRHWSIGEVLNLLSDEFPDVTISKIRFLESQGLIDPERTPSGYRRFYASDLDRLRWILVQQRDHYLPLKVIRARLDAGEAVVDPPSPGADVAASPDQPAADGPEVDDEQGAEAMEPDPVGSDAGDDASASEDGGDPAPAAATTIDPDAEADAVAEANDGRLPDLGEHDPDEIRSADALDIADNSADSDAEADRAATPDDDPEFASESESGLAPEAEGDLGQGEATSAPSEPITSDADGTGEEGPSSDDPVDWPSDARLGAASEPAAETSPATDADDDPDDEPVAPDEAAAVDADGGPLVMTRDDLQAASGVPIETIRELERVGLLHGRAAGSAMLFGPDAIETLAIVGRLGELGLEPRHLRPLRMSIDREVGLFEQIAGPALARRDPSAHDDGRAIVAELRAKTDELRAVLMDRAVESLIPPP